MAKGKNSAPLDMHSIIVNTIVEGKDMPLGMSKKEKKKFAEDIATICELHAFSKSRDDFKKEINNAIQFYINKFS